MPPFGEQPCLERPGRWLRAGEIGIAREDPAQPGRPLGGELGVAADSLGAQQGGDAGADTLDRLEIVRVRARRHRRARLDGAAALARRRPQGRAQQCAGHAQ